MFGRGVGQLSRILIEIEELRAARIQLVDVLPAGRRAILRVLVNNPRRRAPCAARHRAWSGPDNRAAPAWPARPRTVGAVSRRLTTFERALPPHQPGRGDQERHVDVLVVEEERVPVIALCWPNASPWSPEQSRGSSVPGRAPARPSISAPSEPSPKCSALRYCRIRRLPRRDRGPAFHTGGGRR